MKRALWVVLVVVLFLGVFAATPQSAKAWGPCNGPYGGYAGCNYYGSNYGSNYGSYGGYGYNRVCWSGGYSSYRRLYCSYVLVPPYPVSGYYGYVRPYSGYGMYGGYGMYSGYGMYGGYGTYGGY
jgi:hypothetical protein